MKQQASAPIKSGSAPRSASTRTLILFCIVVGLLILGSLLHKVYALVKESKYDGDHRFTVAVTHDPKHYTIISFSPQNKATSVLEIKDKKELPAVEQLLGVPIDGKIRVKQTFSLGESTADMMGALVTNTGKIDTNLTIIDLIRLSLAAKGQSGRNEIRESLNAPFDTPAINDLVAGMFHESIFETENQTMQIINGTDVPGVGKRLERVFINIGGNVVSIKNADTIEKTSKIVYFGEKSKTVERMENILGYPSQLTETQGISDIMIIIGEDTVKQLPY